MANWDLPTTSSLYTDVLTQLKGRDEDIATMFATTPSGTIPTNAIRWSSTGSKWEKYNGSAWENLDSEYAINVTQLGGVGLTELLRKNPTGDQTISSHRLILDGGASADLLRIRAGATLDHVYLSFYADSAAQAAESGRLGYTSAASQVLVLQNLFTDSNLNLITNGTGVVQANGNTVVTVNNTINTLTNTAELIQDYVGAMVTGNTETGGIAVTYQDADGTLDFVISDNGHNHLWSNITNTPTTVVGYGITDAVQEGDSVTLTGDVTGSSTFDTNGNVNITTIVGNDSHTHDTRYFQLTGGTVTGVTSFSSAVTFNSTATFNANVDLQDNDVLYFGTGNDFSIYHSGTGTFLDIADAGVGDLFIGNRRNSGRVYIRADNSVGNHLTCVAAGGTNSDVILYYANSPKLQTISTGIDVTGTVNTDRVSATTIYAEVTADSSTVIRANQYWTGTGTSYAIIGEGNSSVGTGICGQYLGSSTTGRPIYGFSFTSSVRAITGASFGASGQDFYADGSGTYHPFTGAHDGLVYNTFAAEIGDILIDSIVIAKKNISDAICLNEVSTIIADKRVVGILAIEPQDLEKDYNEEVEIKDLNIPAALKKLDRIEIESIISQYDRISINSVGEGQINVCGENGDIDTGDYIITSSIPGKGMKQPDNIYHNYTVAKAREPVVFNSSTEVKQIACIYLCG